MWSIRKGSIDNFFHIVIDDDDGDDDADDTNDDKWNGMLVSDKVRITEELDRAFETMAYHGMGEEAMMEYAKDRIKFNYEKYNHRYVVSFIDMNENVLSP